MDTTYAIVDLLLEKGADVSSTTAAGETPLHLTASLGFLTVEKLLLNHGASATSTENTGDPPLHALAAGGFERAVFGTEAPEELEMQDIDHVDEDVAELLLAHGASVAFKNNAGETPEGLAFAWRPLCGGRKGSQRLFLLALLKKAAATPFTAKQRPRKHARVSPGPSGFRL